MLLNQLRNQRRKKNKIGVGAWHIWAIRKENKVILREDLTARIPNVWKEINSLDTEAKDNVFVGGDHERTFEEL